MPAFLPVPLLAFLAAASLVFGSALPAFPALGARFWEQRLSLLIGFSAGLMLATALHDLLPEALELAPKSAVWGAGIGFLALYVAERMTHFHACRHRRCDVEGQRVEEHEHHAHSHGHSHGHADTMALVGMSIHNFADGLTTAAALGVSKGVGLVVLLAIMLHQSAAGLSLGAIMLRLGRSRRRILIATSVVASFILLGALFYLFAVPVNQNSRGFILGLAGGSFLYVAACDLLPTAHAEDEGWTITATTIGGYAFALAAGYFFGEAH